MSETSKNLKKFQVGYVYQYPETYYFRNKIKVQNKTVLGYIYVDANSLEEAGKIGKQLASDYVKSLNINPTPSIEGI